MGDPFTDDELLTRARAGDSVAFGVLWARHQGEARRYARRLSSDPSRVDDIVDESFAKVLHALRSGSGPRDGFIAYLLVTVRRVAQRDRVVAERSTPVEEEALDAPVEFDDMAATEQALVLEAFGRLPERWQQVLWLVDAEGRRPAEVAPMLGLRPNGVSALAYRAREALREHYLEAHIGATADADACRAVAPLLAGHVRGSLTERRQAQVDAHLEDCDRCRAVVLELDDVAVAFGAAAAPVVGLLGLGAAGTAVAAGGAAAVAGAGRALGSGAARAVGVLVGASVVVALVALVVGTRDSGTSSAAARTEVEDVVDGGPAGTSPPPTPTSPSTRVSDTTVTAPPAPAPDPGAPIGPPSAVEPPIPAPTPTSLAPSSTPRRADPAPTTTAPPSTTTAPAPTTTAPVEPPGPVTVSAEPAGPAVRGELAPVLVRIDAPGRDQVEVEAHAPGEVRAGGRATGAECEAVADRLRCPVPLDADGHGELVVLVRDGAASTVVDVTVRAGDGTGPVLSRARHHLARVAEGPAPLYVGTSDTAVVMAGAPLVACPEPEPDECPASVPVVGRDDDTDPTTQVSSSAALEVPSGARVLWAALVWSADVEAGSGGSPAPRPDDLDRVRLTVGGAAPRWVRATRVDRDGGAYQAVADISDLVRAGTTLGVADAQVGTGDGRWGAWQVVVAHTVPRPVGAALTVVAAAFDVVRPGHDVGIALGAARHGEDRQVEVVGHEGEEELAGDRLLAGTTELTNPFDSRTDGRPTVRTDRERLTVGPEATALVVGSTDDHVVLGLVTVQLAGA